METRLAVLAMWAEDVPAAARFYRDALGLPLRPHRHGQRPHFDLGGIILTILPGKPPSPPAEPRFPLIAFSVPDLEAAVQNLQRRGIDLPWGEESNPAGRWVMLRDPAGNLIELVQWAA